MPFPLPGVFRGGLIGFVAPEHLATFIQWADQAARQCYGLMLPDEPLAWPEDWGIPSIEHYQIDDYRDSSGQDRLHVTIHLIGPTHATNTSPLPAYLAKVALTSLGASYKGTTEQARR